MHDYHQDAELLQNAPLDIPLSLLNWRPPSGPQSLFDTLVFQCDVRPLGCPGTAEARPVLRTPRSFLTLSGNTGVNCSGRHDGCENHVTEKLRDLMPCQHPLLDSTSN
ncbi:hypothetical protein PoB_001227000 [Plakobranchus ocellatus]|uniref:ZP domain-containing protein n=1 Tax=Plakobranchus ocellatus TaxID=259542 RepID=A0AAV3YTJ9_9GAST|nr:hypothetical protein PoB_001227000 [Plakobranchus ocellatus]